MPQHTKAATTKIEIAAYRKCDALPLAHLYFKTHPPTPPPVRP